MIWQLKCTVWTNTFMWYLKCYSISEGFPCNVMTTKAHFIKGWSTQNRNLTIILFLSIKILIIKKRIWISSCNDNPAAMTCAKFWPDWIIFFLIEVLSGGRDLDLQCVDYELIIQPDMSTARRRLKSPQSLSSTSAHPTTVTLVNIMVMNGWLTSFLFHVNRLSHSWDKAISGSDLEISTPRSRSWVWSKGKVIQSAQYQINSPRFHFTSIRPTIPDIELFRNLTLK